MQKLETLRDYMALCGAQHNLKYVAMSVMLSSFIGTSFRRHFSVAMPHKGAFWGRSEAVLYKDIWFGWLPLLGEGRLRSPWKPEVG